jgi:NTE family protein
MISLGAGETLIRQGDQNTDYFLLVSGRLRVFREQDGLRNPIGNVFPGEGVGEMALLLNEPRYATVMARLDCELVRFPQSTFLTLAGRDPMTFLNIARTVITRARGRLESDRKTEYPSVAILPLTPNIDTRRLARGLARKLEKFGPTLCADWEFAGNLDELENRVSFVVYAADLTQREWSRSCLLRADLVFLAVDITTPPDPGELEQEILSKVERSVLGRLDLLLIHPPAWRPQCGASVWLQRLSPTEFHHVRSGNDHDLGRIARITAGRANNMVLSGGGARAFAQIGAMRALKDFGVPVDRIGGTSMGAAVGAVVAFGDGFEELALRMRDLFLQRRPAKDWTLPFLSLLTGKKMESIAVDLFADWTIEDMPTRYFCLSSNLADGEIVEHFNGSLRLALRSTAAFPVVAPPLLRDGAPLIDGGILNNLPIDVMRNHFSGSVIAIDVSEDKPLIFDNRWDGRCPSGFEILKERLTGGGTNPGLPNILEILLRTATLASGRQARLAREQADLLLTPPVESFGFMDFDEFDRIVKSGYEYTAQLLQNLERSPEGLHKFRGE